MLTIEQLKGLLKENEKECALILGRRDGDERRLFDLWKHREIVQKLLIEALENELNRRNECRTK